MAVAKKKSKKVTKKLSENKLQEKADTRLAEFKAQSLVRFQQASKVIDQQDPATKDAIDRMIGQLVAISRRRMWVAESRGSDHRAIVDIPEETIRHNATYMALEIVKDLALMDVQVEGFKYPKGMCGTCARPLKGKA